APLHVTFCLGGPGTAATAPGLCCLVKRSPFLASVRFNTSGQTMLGEQRCEGPEQFKAWSQNLGHINMLTTFTSYGNLTQHRQDELLQRMAQDPLPLTENAPRALVAMDPAVLERLERAIDRLGPRAGQTYCWLKR